jgi:hypothetical protein
VSQESVFVKSFNLGSRFFRKKKIKDFEMGKELRYLFPGMLGIF